MNGHVRGRAFKLLRVDGRPMRPPSILQTSIAAVVILATSAICRGGTPVSPDDKPRKQWHWRWRFPSSKGYQRVTVRVPIDFEPVALDWNDHQLKVVEPADQDCAKLYECKVTFSARKNFAEVEISPANKPSDRLDWTCDKSESDCWWWSTDTKKDDLIGEWNVVWVKRNFAAPGGARMSCDASAKGLPSDAQAEQMIARLRSMCETVEVK
jgi:hypothetical protein